VSAWSIDNSPQTSNLIVTLAQWFGAGLDESAKSTDGGQTWTQFATVPPTNAGGQSLIGGSIVAASDSHYIIAQNNGTRAGVFYTADSGATWTEATIGSVPLSTSGSSTGWTGSAYYLNRRVLTCSKVTADLCWALNPGVSGNASFAGVYKTTNGGSSWSQVYSGLLTSFADEYYSVNFRVVPGVDTDLFYTGGGSNNAGTPASLPVFKRSKDGGATWTNVPNVTNVTTYGFGAPAYGKTYPTLYIAAFVTFDSGSTYKWGVYRSVDADQATPTWQLVANYPLNSGDGVTALTGDPNVYGTVYIAFRGSGYAVGQFNYLLKRDVMPDAANDNTPMWLNEVG
jgi:hypothetical protein